MVSAVNRREIESYIWAQHSINEAHITCYATDCPSNQSCIAPRQINPGVLGDVARQLKASIRNDALRDESYLRAHKTEEKQHS